MDINSAVVAVESAFGFMIDELEGCSNFDKESIEREKQGVIALLKEHEPIKPIHDDDGYYHTPIFRYGDIRQKNKKLWSRK